MIDVKVKKALGVFRVQAELHDTGFICLSGRNGSGKSTLLRIIAGQMKPDEGSISIDSAEITTVSAEQRKVVLVTPESFIPHLSVEKHLRWGMAARKVPQPDQFVAEVKSGLRISFDGRVDKLSLGMRERVSLATALLSSPRVLLVDEAFSNLDDRESFISAYKELCAKLKADVIFTTQKAEDSLGADHHYVMEGGTSSRLF